MKNNLSSNATLDHCQFISNERKKLKTPSWIDAKKEDEFLLLSTSVEKTRAILLLSRKRSKEISSYILSEKGDLKEERIDEVIGDLQSPYFSLSLFPAEEWNLAEKIISFLRELKKNKNISQLLKRMGLVFQDEWVERIAQMSCVSKGKITPYYSRLSLLSAYLCPLRQTVGSCFATAPAILIQQQQGETLIGDLVELLQKGELKRVFQGRQIAIPISRKFDFVEFSQKTPLELLMREPLIHLYEPFLEREEGDLFIQKSDLFEALESLRKKDPQAKEMSMKDLFSFAYERVHLNVPNERAELLFRLELLSSQISPLLKAWEYTISSFTQGGRSFSDWNLYISLGLSHQEPHGIGSAIAKEIDFEREALIKKAERMKDEIASSYDQLKTLEALLKQAGSEREIARLRAQFEATLHHHYSCKELQRDSVTEANHLFELFNSFFEWLHRNFELFFQELFDPELFFAKEELTFDSPAGFRLFAKGGIEGTYAWNAIDNIEQFQRSIIEFFQKIEPLALEHFLKRPDQKILDRWFKIIHAELRSPLFLEASIERAKKAHLSISGKTGNTALQSVQATPWCYLSGGSMKELVQYYFGLSDSPTIELFEAQDAESLLSQLHRTIILSGLSQRNDQLLLAQSPSHGFTLFSKELFSLIEKIEQHKKSQEILYSRHLSPQVAHELIIQFLNGWPEGIKETFLKQANFGDIRRQGDWLKASLNLFKEILPGPLMRTASSFLCSYFRKKVLSVPAGELYEVIQTPYESHKMLSCEEIYFMASLEGTSSGKSPKELIEQLQAKGLFPSSIMLGDTNWTGYHLGAEFDPYQKSYSLWRVDPWGAFGYPLLEWDVDCFPGEWGVFVKPVEYTLLSKQFYLKV